MHQKCGLTKGVASLEGKNVMKMSYTCTFCIEEWRGWSLLREAVWGGGGVGAIVITAFATQNLH